MHPRFKAWSDHLVGSLRKQPPWVLLTAGFVMVIVVGIFDYLTEASLTVFYLLPIVPAAWFVGPRYAVTLAVLSSAVWFVGEVAAGVHYSSPLVPAWNALILLAFFLVVIWLVGRLRQLHQNLEGRVRERTAALVAEIAEREQLEKEVLKISEQERRRIGHDLHDDLCQHLAATALAGQVLANKLAAKGSPEVADANHVVDLVEDGFTLARKVAHGLSPNLPGPEGLMEALRELASRVSELFNIQCRFQCDAPVYIHEEEDATQLYRITQEAISNAIHHGQAKHIVVELSATETGTVLEVSDDGVGIPDPPPVGQGMGLRLMRYRARMMGATLTVRRSAAGGTVVTCTSP